jgi:hypothetical protein
MMRRHPIGAIATAILLLSGVMSALAAARIPSSVAARAKTEGIAVSAELADLHASVEMLRARASSLEIEINKLRSAMAQTPSSVKAPFEVVDGAGNPIFTVTNQYDGSSPKKGQVHIGVNSYGIYQLSIHNSSGQLAVGIGSAKAGSGVVQVQKAGKYVASLSDMGLTTVNGAGKEVTHLGADPTDRERGELKVRGGFSILDANFGTVIDGGTLPDGRGAIRTWPNEDCRTFAGLRPPTCLMGVIP